MHKTPGVALFYGGMVRQKNVLSTYVMGFAIITLALISGAVVERIGIPRCLFSPPCCWR